MPMGVIGLIYAVGMAFVPHSPRHVHRYSMHIKCSSLFSRWLVKRGREKEALAVLSWINGHNKEKFVDTVLELKELRESTAVKSTQSFSVAIKQIFRWKYR